MSQDNLETTIKLVQKDMSYIKASIDELKEQMKGNYVTRSEFKPVSDNYVSRSDFVPVRNLVFGFVGTALTALVGALIASVLK